MFINFLKTKHQYPQIETSLLLFWSRLPWLSKAACGMVSINSKKPRRTVRFSSTEPWQRGVDMSMCGFLFTKQVTFLRSFLAKQLYIFLYIVVLVDSRHDLKNLRTERQKGSGKGSWNQPAALLESTCSDHFTIEMTGFSRTFCTSGMNWDNLVWPESATFVGPNTWAPPN